MLKTRNNTQQNVPNPWSKSAQKESSNISPKVKKPAAATKRNNIETPKNKERRFR